MKKISFRNVLSKKALSAVTALAISGLVPAGFALAGELEITSELVASSKIVFVEQGATQSFNLIVSSIGNVTDANVKLPTKFTIAANETITTSNSVTVNLAGKDDSENVPATIQVDSNLKPGTYSYTFNSPDLSFTNSNSSGSKLENKSVDTITFVVTKKQVLDTTAPVVTATPERAPDSNDWYNQNVTVNFSALDEEGGSGLLQGSVSAPVTVSTDGTHTITGTASDIAGNIGTSAPITLKLDKTAPTISGSADREANPFGWYKDNVKVSFNADDALSGVASVTGDQILGEGADQSVSGTATDKAGNNKTATVSGINIDKTAPTISGSTDREANPFAWYKDNVKVSFNADDALSGVANVIGDQTLGEGADQSATGTATDKAGNDKSVTVSGINIDKTAPTISGSPDREANLNGWYNDDVVVTFTANDSLSGVASFTQPVTLSEEGLNKSATGTATDKAGNDKTTTVSGINIDKTAPTISGSPDREADSNGWYNDDVVVTFTANDSLSGVASFTQPVTLSEESLNKSATGTATDYAGNTSAPATVSGLKIDKTKPGITIGGITLKDNVVVSNIGTFTLNQLATWSASDALSGLATEEKGTLNTATAGLHTITLTATDKAGNTFEKTIVYNVAYNFGGVLQPINSNGSSIFKAGSTIPVKFQLTNAQGALVSSANATISLKKVTDAVLGTNYEVSFNNTPNSGDTFRYDFSSNQYIYNLSTKSLSSGSYIVSIDLHDGSEAKTVCFSLK